MKILKNSMRYELLAKQFQKEEPTVVEIQDSLDRIFFYIYNYTDLMYLEFIDDQTLYSYIQFHRSKGFNEISFIETIKDIKNFLCFLKKIKKVKNTPQVDLSIKNLSLRCQAISR
ncbi:hypothetical protein JMM81_22425 [Bacillus sp. V3B]|uniref:hypothetical protein n=1 Tax=Bacillus sp. V3B TaxID=2804915 RepID=UPI00210CD0FA|nr:hypothetical protein [Bacillus sp. V3B]MCQ6277609.1 hypothetical protein [Bacillus sp. V3B]